MNDRNNMDSTGTVNSDDVLVADETTITDKRGSVCHGQFICGRYFRWYCFCFLVALVFGIMWFLDIKANATENSVYVDSEYMASQFGSYNYYAIVTDGAGNYATIYSDGQIISTGTTIHSLLTNGYYGFNTMKIEDDYLVIDETGKSYNGQSTVTVQLNSLNIGYTSSINQIIWSNVDIYTTVFSNTGSPSASDVVIHSVANNIGSKPVEEPTEPTPTPDITVDCNFTDVNIVASVNALNDNLVAKMDIVITLLIVIIALRMFSPLANNHKRGLDKKEK